MDAARFGRVKALYQVACNLPDEERTGFLDTMCPDDSEVRSEVERLLEPGASREVDLLERDLGATSTAEIGPEPGDRIGPYTLVRAVGEGGMGLVFEAAQRDPIRRRVALKVIKPGMDSRQVLARFESERQALALLSHAHIARVLDAGAAESGRPFFVMEYVGGEPVTSWCDRRRLDVETRLGLLAAVCDGVQHAHRKGILHRDLKPSNVLVTEDEGEPCPKIIDFGIAKALDERLTDITLQTRGGQVVGTPGYMSPEQAEDAGLDVDSRTDVYSLGVMMYEMLVGALPFDSSRTGRQAGEESREKGAARPSVRLASLADEQSGEVAARRGTDPRGLRRALRGELDWIAMRALETDRERRYGSASELAADIRRYLRHEPILAGPPGAGYRARKFMRRHRVAVAAASLVLLAVLGGTVGTTIGLVRARRAERQARQEALTATRASDFLASVFELSDLRVSSRADTTARELLDRGMASIESELSDAPVVQARLLYTMGKANFSINRLEETRHQLEAALEIQRRELGEDHLETLRTQHELGYLYWATGPLTEGVRLLEKTRDGRRRVLGPEHPDTLRVMRDLANAYMRAGRLDEAELLLLDTLDRQRRLLGEDHFDTLRTTSELADVYRKRGTPGLAVPLYRRVLEALPDEFDADRFLAPQVKMCLASALRDQGQLGDDVEALYLESIEDFRRSHHAASKPIEKAQTNLALLYQQRGELEKAETLARATVDAWRSTQSAEHPDTLLAIHNLGIILVDLGRSGEAGTLLAEAFDGRLRVLGSEHRFTLASARALMDLHDALGDQAAAERVANAVLEGLGPGHPARPELARRVAAD